MNEANTSLVWLPELLQRLHESEFELHVFFLQVSCIVAILYLFLRSGQCRPANDLHGHRRHVGCLKIKVRSYRPENTKH